MKIYTKKGDGGETSLFGGTRVTKDHPRIEAYGTVDELNSFLGLLRDEIGDSKWKENLIDIQRQLFSVGASLAAEKETQQYKIPSVSEDDVLRMEDWIDEITEKLEPMKFFILPGGHKLVSYCHIARTVCRRAERMVIRLSEKVKVDPMIVKYLNRLSDFLFIFSRKLSHDLKIKELPWNAKDTL